MAELVAKLKRELRPARILGSEPDRNAVFPIAQDIGHGKIPPMINPDQIELAATAVLPDLFSGGSHDRRNIAERSQSPIVAIHRELERRRRRGRLQDLGACPRRGAHSQGCNGANEMAACERCWHRERADYLPRAGCLRERGIAFTGSKGADCLSGGEKYFTAT